MIGFAQVSMVMRGFSAVCSVEASGLNLQRSCKSKLHFNPVLIRLISLWGGGEVLPQLLLGISIISYTQKTECMYSCSSFSSDAAKFVSGQEILFIMTVWGVFRLYERALLFFSSFMFYATIWHLGKWGSIHSHSTDLRRNQPSHQML